MMFSNEYYKNIALNYKKDNEKIHSIEDCFILLINGLDKEDLLNLCIKIQEYFKKYSPDLYLSIDDCYKLTQNISHLSKENKKLIKELAFECVDDRIYLGSRTILNGEINTSAWISHSIYSSKLASTLSQKLNINSEKAEALALLHDYGRKYSHSFSHVILGFENLIKEGFYNEAISCLTHSFVKGGRCANNEPSIEGFEIDEKGKPYFKEDLNKDDLTLFLENYKYDIYDLILNITDLMATDKGIVSPIDRINDIASRRNIDIKNRKYFILEFTNLLNEFLNYLGFTNKPLNKYKATNDITLDEAMNLLTSSSSIFFDCYNIISENKETISRRK